MSKNELILIPPGAFIMGSDVESFYGTIVMSSVHAKPDEAPIQAVGLDAYYIDKYPVTNAEYGEFIAATNHLPPRHWDGSAYPKSLAHHPVVYVSWHDAQAYAQWAGKRLTTETEWEKAARGVDGRIYPWGNKFDSSKCSLSIMQRSIFDQRVGSSAPIVSTAPVGGSSAGASPYGVFDMAGNVWEWTSDWYLPYAGNISKNRDYGEKEKVIRGGSWLEGQDETLRVYTRCANRLHAPPNYKGSNIGFRCAKDVSDEVKTQLKPQIQIQELNNYLRKQKIQSLRKVLKLSREGMAKSLGIAIVLGIGSSYALGRTGSTAILGIILAIISAGFVFTAGVNFWRQMKAAKLMQMLDKLKR
jgi:formylglycine-generating enzyme required for sulfatase activity